MTYDLLRSKRGSTLTLIILLVLFASLLATATIGIALGENRLAIAEEKTMQSYYTARSVTEVTARKIARSVEEMSVFDAIVPAKDSLDPIYSATGTTTEGISYEVSVTRSGTTGAYDNLITVSTTAYRLAADGVTRQYEAKASKLLEETGAGFFESAIYARTLLYARGNGQGSNRDVEGDVVYEGEVIGAFDVFGGTLSKNWNPFNFKPIYAPKNVHYVQTIDDGTWGSTVTITGNTEYTGTLRMTTNHTTVMFENPSSGAAPDSIYLTIDTLDLSGTSNPVLTFDATGVNRVLIYFNGPILPFNDPETTRKITLEILSSETSPSVFVAINTTTYLYMDGSQVIQAYVYAPFSTLDFGGTSNDIHGSILANIVNVHGGINVVYPQDTNIFSNNYEYIATTVVPHRIADETWLPRN